MDINELTLTVSALNTLGVIALGVYAFYQNKELTKLNAELDKKNQVSISVSKDKRDVLKKINTKLDDYMKEFSSLSSIDPFDENDLKYYDCREKLLEAIKELEMYTDNKRLKLFYNKLLNFESKWSEELRTFHYIDIDLADRHIEFREGGEPFLGGRQYRKEKNEIDQDYEKLRGDLFSKPNEEIMTEFRSTIREMNLETD